jgi:hypothetical protein
MRSGRRALSYAVAAAPVIALSTIAACTGTAGPGSQDVGAPCSADSQCEDRCFKSAEFADGMCSRICRVDQDCPIGSACVENGGGFCAVSCQAPVDCSGFGAGWTCSLKADAGGGQALVCRIP